MATRSKPKPRTTARGSGSAANRSHPKAPIALPRTSKGKRPQFYENVAVDQLMAIVTALTAEVSVAFDRIDTLERVLLQSGALGADEMEGFTLSEHAAEVRKINRLELIQRVFAVFDSYGANRAR